jgi:hypothetical protein
VAVGRRKWIARNFPLIQYAYGELYVIVNGAAIWRVVWKTEDDWIEVREAAKELLKRLKAMREGV